MPDFFERLKIDAAEEWWAYIAHEFVRGLGEGTLPRDCFRHYLVQDYLFLIQFARAYALAAFKATDLSSMQHGARGRRHTRRRDQAPHPHCRAVGEIGGRTRGGAGGASYRRLYPLRPRHGNAWRPSRPDDRA